MQAISNLPANKRRFGIGALRGSLALAALGIVFGDIGTSPLYTLSVCFSTTKAPVNPENVIGIVSALIWTLILVVCLKYMTIMRVDNNGEGGILALLAKALPMPKKGVAIGISSVLVIGIVGAAALLGDGIITPAISVLSAVEGLSVISPDAVKWEAAIAAGILVGLFLVQKRGTASVGSLFGPIMAVWFATIAVAGGARIGANIAILRALNPMRAITFMTHHGVLGFLLLGATILCVTGVEALYADMSHFGRKPIVKVWGAIVLPALLLCYLGQGATLLGNPKAIDNIFFALVPAWGVIPMVVLATAATIIASQALISGAFTLVEQGVALGLFPRVRVIHTSDKNSGQIYVPSVNIVLAIGCIALVAIFKNSNALAAAYGLAVALTMATTTILYFTVIRNILGWNPIFCWTALVGFLGMDLAFIGASLTKIPEGGWFPLLVAALVSASALNWYDGRRRMALGLNEGMEPIEDFLVEMRASKPHAIEGTAVFLTANADGIPYIMRSHWAHAQVMHERIILLTLLPIRVPYVKDDERVSAECLHENLLRVTAKFGFMETPTLKAICECSHGVGIDLENEDTFFVAASPQISCSEQSNMSSARRWLFEIMLKLARPLPKDLGIPPHRLVQFGVDVQM